MTDIPSDMTDTTEKTTEQSSLDLVMQDLTLVQEGVEWFTQEFNKSMADKPPFVATTLNAYMSILQRGGKRIRGVLTIAGYDMYGGDDKQLVARAAGIVEAVQAELLVLDDVSDRAVTRRGGPTAHVMIEESLRQLGADGELLGVTAMDLATNSVVGVHGQIQMMLSGLNAPPERLLKAIWVLNNHLQYTGSGQIMDIVSTTGVAMTEAEILEVARTKTAYYTFESPLEIGALLAGADEQEFSRIKKYSEATGLAFQMQDDVMGVFGDEQKMGKSAMGDIIEGKQTMLMFYAKQKANKTERQLLESALGNPKLTNKAFAACQEIIERTGARARVEAMALDYVDQAHEAIAKPPAYWKPVRVEQLYKLATFAVERSV